MSDDPTAAAAQLEALAETTTDVLITMDADSVIRFVNPAVEEMLGYDPDALVGEPLTALMPERLQERHSAAVDRYLETGERNVDWSYVELPGCHRDGHEVPLAVSFGEFTQDGEQFFTGVVRDITEQKRLEAERDLLYSATREIAESDTFVEGLTATLAVVGEAMDRAAGEAWVPTNDAERLERVATWTADRDVEDLDGEGGDADSNAHTVTAGEGPVGRAWESREPEWTADSTDRENPPFEQVDAPGDAGTALAVPVVAEGEVLAVLAFLLPRVDDLDPETVERTHAVATNLGEVLTRKRVEDALRQERNLTTNVLETSPVGIVVVELDGEFRYANPRAGEILRFDPESAAELSYEALSGQLVDEDGEPLSVAERPSARVIRSGRNIARNVRYRRPDGEICWLSVQGTPLRDAAEEIDGALFAFEDVTQEKRRTSHLEVLSRFGQRLSVAETRGEACEEAIATAAEVVDLPIAEIRLYDSDTGRLERCGRTETVEELVGERPLFDQQVDLPWRAFTGGERRIHDDLLAATDLEADDTPLRSLVVLPLGKHGVFVAGASSPGAITEMTVTLAEILVANTLAALDRIDREAALREQKNQLAETNDRLVRLERINRQIRDITRALMAAESRSEIEQTVCDRLLEAGETYRFVWFGALDLATDRIEPQSWAGDEQGYLDAVTVTADSSETGRGPAGEAVRTRESQAQNDLWTDPPFEPWREQTMERGFRSSIAVPVVYRDTVYGVVNLYAGEPDEFSEMERTVLTELGEMIGYAINAIERKAALVSEDSTELEFLVRDADDPLLQFLRETGGQFTLETLRRQDSGELQVFGTFLDLPPESVHDLTSYHRGIGEMRIVRQREDETVAEATLDRESLVGELLERGAVTQAIRASGEEGRVVVRVPRSASVREFVDLFERRYDDVELVGRRESGEPIRTTEEFEAAYLDALTERQEEVLQMAYFAGFFEWPRDSSAKDVADLLDVSQPTVSRHVREGERKLFSMLFDRSES